MTYIYYLTIREHFTSNFKCHRIAFDHLGSNFQFYSLENIYT